MYTKRGITYADPGKLLRGGGSVSYSGPSNIGYTEIDVPTDDIIINDGIAYWGSGLCGIRLGDNPSYNDIKTRLIKMRYSNDDQIAVMLNGDAEEMRRMQQWRTWASEMAKAICSRLGI